MAVNATLLRTTGTLGASPLGKRNPPWTPSLLPGLALSLDADSGVATTGSGPPSVTSWTGSAGNVLTGTAGNYPTKEGSLNGHVPVRFAGGTQFLTIPALTIVADRLYYFVLNMTAAPAATQRLVYLGSPVGITIGSTGTLQVFVESTTVLNAGAGSIGAGLHVIVVYKDATDGLYHVRINGVDKVSGARTAAANTAAGRIGSNQSPTGGLVDGSVPAFGMAAGAQALLDVQKLEGYLAQRFSASTLLANGHPYQTAIPRKLT